MKCRAAEREAAGSWCPRAVPHSQKTQRQHDHRGEAGDQLNPLNPSLLDVVVPFRHFRPPKLTLIGPGLALLHGCFHVKTLNNQRGRPRVSVHIRALAGFRPTMAAGLGSTVVAHAREFRAADIQRTDQPTVQAIRHMGACCGRAASGRVPLRRNEVAMSHLLLVVDDRRSSAPKVVAASSIRDC